MHKNKEQKPKCSRLEVLERLKRALREQKSSNERPSRFGAHLERRRRPAAKQVEIGEEVVWTPAALKAADELQQNACNSDACETIGARRSTNQ